MNKISKFVCEKCGVPCVVTMKMEADIPDNCLYGEEEPEWVRVKSSPAPSTELPEGYLK